MKHLSYSRLGMFPGTVLSALVLTLVLALSGCGGSGGLTVEGEVTLDGVPIPDGAIVLMPVDGKTTSDSLTITNGRFSGTSQPGEKTVQFYAYREIEMPPAPTSVSQEPELVKEQYLPESLNTGSTQRITISAENNEKLNFPLTTPTGAK